MTYRDAAIRTLWIALAFLLGATLGAARNHVAIIPVAVVDVTDGSIEHDQLLFEVEASIEQVDQQE